MNFKYTLLIISLAIYLPSTFAQDKTYNPFETFDKDLKVLTLSNGKNDEFFDMDTIEIIGQAILNTKTMKVIGFVEEDNERLDASLETEIANRFLSIDPLAVKYPFFSPYSFVANSPIQFVDPDGRVIKVATKEGQAQTLAILTKAFGEKATGFSFNENNELKFTGDPNSFEGIELEVFNGLNTIITSETITNIVFKNNSFTKSHGGEATQTIEDNPKLNENTIYISPSPFVTTITGENYKTEYEAENGGTTTDINSAKKDDYGRPIKTGYAKKQDVTITDSKSARFFHGIGHVLFPKKDEQEDVIKYDNKARTIFKKQKKNGAFKNARETPRPLDEKHKNKN